MPFSSEILIGINIRGAADWLAPLHIGGDKGSMSNDGQALNRQNMAKLSWEGVHDFFLLLHEHCECLCTRKVGMTSDNLERKKKSLSPDSEGSGLRGDDNRYLLRLKMGPDNASDSTAKLLLHINSNERVSSAAHMQKKAKKKTLLDL